MPGTCRRGSRADIKEPLTFSDLRLPAFMCGMFAAASVYAQVEQGASGDRKLASGLEEIVVTATRHEESLSRVPISVSAFTQESMDVKGIKDILDVARFTPGLAIDGSGTNNISIRGISSTGGSGTTGIYIDDTPIQIRGLAFNPDEALPKSFDMARVEVLRGPQGTLFGAGSEGGTVRYITTPPSLAKTSVYSRAEISTTKGGDQSYEAGIAAGGPIIDDKLGARLTVWYRRDGGYIDHIDPVTLATLEKASNHSQTVLLRLAGLWAVSETWSVTPSIVSQDTQRHDIATYWPLYSNPGSDHFVNADPSRRASPDKFYLPALKIEGNLGGARIISNTSYFHRWELTGYEGTLYDLAFYPAQGAAPIFPRSSFLPGVHFPLLDANGLHLPAGATNYRSPSAVNNGQQNITQEVRLQSNDANSRLTWTTGLFFSANRQSYDEQIHDPLLNELSIALTGQPYTNFFVDASGAPVTYDPRFPDDAWFLQIHARDEQYALFGEATYGITDQLKLTAGARVSKNKFSFDTLVGGPQLFSAPRTGTGDNNERAFTPKLGLAYQRDPQNLYYATYAKGFRPGGANNPVPYAACASDFQSFNIPGAPPTYSSDSVNSFEVGAKNNINNRIKIASSIYYIKWNNIQQTVVPPICQISFIANLGQATVKGADIQADIAVTDSFTVELAAGYTDARYSKDVGFNVKGQNPIVHSGDAIVGQSSEVGGGKPDAPFTTSVGLEYRLTAFTKDTFVRADGEYQSRAKWITAAQDPNSLQYDSANFTLDSTTFVSLRGGVLLGPWTISAFVDNLTDSHTLTNYNYTINPGTGDSRLRRDFTFRPRTIGMTFVMRK